MATKTITKKKTAAKKPAAKPMTKAALLNALTDANSELSRKQVREVLESLSEIGHKQLKRVGVFTVPGFAKFSVVKKKATRARKGINPFTGEETTFKAKPAYKQVKARPVKAVKDAVA